MIRIDPAEIYSRTICTAGFSPSSAPPRQPSAELNCRKAVLSASQVLIDHVKRGFSFLLDWLEGKEKKFVLLPLQKYKLVFDLPADFPYPWIKPQSAVGTNRDRVEVQSHVAGRIWLVCPNDPAGLAFFAPPSAESRGNRRRSLGRREANVFRLGGRRREECFWGGWV